MDRARAVLPEIDLVDVGVHDVRLLEATLENDGHHRFLGLAPQRAPAVEEVALHQLLRERAAALLDLPGAHVDEHRAQDRQRIDAVVAVELAVLDRLERRGQQRRNLVRGDDDPVLAVQREDAADQQRVEADHRHVRALRVRERGDRVAGEPDPQRARGLRLVRVAEGAQVHVHAVAATAIRARPVGRCLRKVAEPLELLDEPRGGQRLPDVELDRLRVDACRKRPAPSLELLRDAMPRAPARRRRQRAAAAASAARSRAAPCAGSSPRACCVPSLAPERRREQHQEAEDLESPEQHGGRAGPGLEVGQALVVARRARRRRGPGPRC